MTAEEEAGAGGRAGICEPQDFQGLTLEREPSLGLSLERDPSLGFFAHTVLSFLPRGGHCSRLSYLV